MTAADVTSRKSSSSPAKSGPNPSRGGSDRGAVAQLKGALRGGGGFDEQAAMLAPRGANRLPGPVQAKMEGAFGADFSDVRVHQGGAAAGIGAKAFAQGNDLHFAPGAYQPESQSGQELIGHELAHVVQQRQGRVAPTMQAKGGMNINTDVGLEHEADVLGARAARGERVGGGGGGTSVSGPGVVQGLFVMAPPQSVLAFGHDFDGNGAMRIADDGTMAAPAGEGVKSFYATKDHIKSSNKTLEGVKSKFRLSAEPGLTYQARSATNKAVTLHKVVGEAESRGERGDDLTGGPNCNQMAGEVMGKGKVKGDSLRQIKGTKMLTSEVSTTGLDLFRYVNGMASGKSKSKSERDVKELNHTRWTTPVPEVMVDVNVFEVVATDDEGAKGRVNAVIQRWTVTNRRCGKLVNMVGNTFELGVVPSKVATVARELAQIDADMHKEVEPSIASATDSGRTDRISFGEKDTTQRENEDEQVLTDYDNLPGGKRDKALEKAKLNQYASPDVGEAFGIHAVEKRGEHAAFPYHWAGVVAKAGSDTVTLENYAGREKEDVYFTMYGPQTKVDTKKDEVKKATAQGTKAEKESTTFHGQWKDTFPGIHTITHATEMVKDPKKGK